MNWLTFFYLRWIDFWRLPVTDEIRRVHSKSHTRRVDILRLVWLFLVLALAMIGQLVLLIVGLLFMTFVSFMFLDEAEPVTLTVKHSSRRHK